MIPLTAIFTTHHYHLMTMSHHLTDDYWESLGPNSPLLGKIFHNQAQQLIQLQMANNALEDCALEAQSDAMDAASKAVSSVVQVILTNMQLGPLFEECQSCLAREFQQE